MKILILDGNSIINRAFYGIRTLTTKDGIFTNAVYGFLNILMKLEEQVEPDCVMAAFDLRAPTFRHEIYSDYKSGRKPMPEELAMQMPLVKKLLPLMGIKILEKEGYEADDFLGTVSRICKENGHECFIATGDRDSLQLVSDNTSVLLAATKMGQPDLTVYNTDKIIEVYGVRPIQLIDVKALMGDSSDHIPGVAGVGEKTALTLISKFGSLDGVYENIDSPDVKEGVRTKLKNDKDNAYMSYKLGKINCEVPCEISFEKEEEKRDELRRELAHLELFRIIKRMGLDGELETNPKNTPKTDAGVLEVEENPDFSVAKDEKIYAVFKCEGENVTAAAVKDKGKILLFTELEKIERLISLENPFVTYDLKTLYRTGKDIKNPEFDVLLCAYILNPSANNYDISRLSAEYSVVAPSVENSDEKYSELLRSTAVLPSLYETLLLRLGDGKPLELLKNIEIPLSKVLADMERDGFLVDAEGIKEFGNRLDMRIKELEAGIYASVGYEFNLNSPKQLGEALFVKLGLPAKKKTKSGFSTGAEVLESLRDAHPAVGDLLEYRQLAKLKSTYVDGLLSVISPDGRIHSTFNQTETRTGRISSSEPNLQNIPVRRELGREMRKFFTAREGCVLCDADYSQIELRVLAHMSNDKHMIDAFLNGADIHTSTASKVFGVPEEMVTPIMRSRAKAVNFGIVYGIGAFSLSKDLGISFSEAKNYIKNYMETYNGVANYMDDTVSKAKNDGFAETLLGRRRYLPELSASSAVTRSFGERVARNMPVQGTAADIIKIAMINVCRALKEEGLSSKLILQVHDELIVEAPINEAERVSQILKREMENAVSMKVPLTVDCNIGSNWYDAKG